MSKKYEKIVCSPKTKKRFNKILFQEQAQMGEKVEHDRMMNLLIDSYEDHQVRAND